jgi:hypothetical protein
LHGGISAGTIGHFCPVLIKQGCQVGIAVGIAADIKRKCILK